MGIKVIPEFQTEPQPVLEPLMHAGAKIDKIGVSVAEGK
jgi:hypothetical protein